MNIWGPRGEETESRGKYIGANNSQKLSICDKRHECVCLEAQQVPRRMNTKIIPAKHLIIT